LRVIVVGAGIAGLAAAWRLREHGAEVVLVERNADVGGRCRSHLWQGRWRMRGAVAFVGSETNLVDQANAVGIYDTAERVDLTHVMSPRILSRKHGVVPLAGFTAKEILLSPLIPARQKLALGLILPKLLAQLVRNDPRDPTSARALDTQSACAYFRPHAPAFVDYILEPTMQMFCGYGEDDFSLAWLVWLMAGFEWAHHWWSFKERGVGLLTHAMGERLARDGCEIRLGTTVERVARDASTVSVLARGPGGAEALQADAAVIAVPGSAVAALLPDLDAERAAFFRDVAYVGHHIVYFALDGLPEGVPPTLVLPTVDGFRCAAVIAFTPQRGGHAVASAELKGAWCAEARAWPDDRILDAAWSDIVAAVPAMAQVGTIDRYLQRNDAAICRREAGYIARLDLFRRLAPLDRVAFAGDYLINSTVGQAHWSGLQAADDLLARLARV
jgi:oxygen-dependent protoporphyrinogen oxidase